MEEYGKNIIEKYNLIKSRKIEIIEDYEEEKLEEYLQTIFSTFWNTYDCKIARKKNTIGFYMKYHVDDAQIIKRKQGFPDQIQLNHNHYLNYNKNPNQDLVVYHFQ